MGMGRMGLGHVMVVHALNSSKKQKKNVFAIPTRFETINSVEG